MSQLIDRYNRNLNYLRISITDRCNLRCRYCVPLTPMTMLTHTEILRYEEILRFVKIGVQHGITKVRVTGGEPLVRKGVISFLHTLSEFEELEDISITTNGLLLKENIDNLKSAGIKRLNISLDSLDRENFKKISGLDQFSKVWDGIMAALDSGFAPIKINVVALNDFNRHELIDFAELSLRYPFSVRFIEYMPIGRSPLDAQKGLLTPDIKEIISPLGNLIPIRKKENDGPAQRYRFDGAPGEIGFISPISQHFCSQCNRLRLTANGMLRSCLLSEDQTDLRTLLRESASDDDIANLLLGVIKQKQFKHHIGSNQPATISSQMCSIGG